MRLLPSSLFGRMLALSLLATLAALAVAGVAIGGVLERFVVTGIDARLGDRLIALQSAIQPNGSFDRAQLARVSAHIPFDEPWRIESAGQATGTDDIKLVEDTMRHGPPFDPPRPPEPMRRDLNRVGAPFEGRLRDGTGVHGLVATSSTASGDARVIVAVARAEIDRPVRAALTPLAASLAILGLALGGAALLQLRFGLRPLTKLQLGVEAIRNGRATRVPEDMPDELVPLARELNALVADNAAALTGARESAANLAHALKTPVATLVLHLGEDPVALAQLGRIDATLRHHLGRARAVATDRRATTRLLPALTDLAAAITALHTDRVHVRLEVSDTLASAIDPQDLDELAGNLIDNAARHAASTVVVGAIAAGRHVLLTVADDGPGIPAADRSRATAPGTRLDERGSGHGFGLAIARELAELYGGTLTLADAPGGGLLASVTLPIVSRRDPA